DAHQVSALDAERMQDASGVVGQIGDRVGPIGGIAVAHVPVVQGEGAVAASETGQLLVPALTFGSQARQQDDDTSGLWRARLLVCQLSPANRNEAWLREWHHRGLILTRLRRPG